MISTLVSSRFATAAFCAALAVSAPAARAAVVVWDVADVTTPVSAAYNANGVWFNFFTGATTVVNDGNFLNLAHGLFQLNFNESSAYLNLTDKDPFLAGGNWVTFGNGPGRLSAGTVIDASQSFTSNPNTIMASADSFVNAWDGQGQGFLGFKFTDGSSTYYGYADIVVNSNYTATLRGFAYNNTPDASITTSAIPEPSTFAVAAGGLVLGAAVWLRRRRA